MISETKPFSTISTFKTTEEAWFWCSKKNTYSSIKRPYDRLDILKIVERLYRNRRLTMDHLRVMVFYGARQSKPNPNRFQEVRAFHVWQNAMQILGAVLEKEGMVSDRIQRAVIDFSLERAQKVSA